MKEPEGPMVTDILAGWHNRPYNPNIDGPKNRLVGYCEPEDGYEESASVFVTKNDLVVTKRPDLDPNGLPQPNAHKK